MDEDHVVTVTSPSRRDIEFLFVLHTEVRHGMQNDLIPGGMEKLLRLYRMIPTPITEPLRNYQSLSINGREQRVIEVGKKLKHEVMTVPGTSNRVFSSKVRCLEAWLKSYHELTRIEREMEREKDRRFDGGGDESLGGYRPNQAYRTGATTLQLQREQIQQFQDGLRASLDNTPWF